MRRVYKSKQYFTPINKQDVKTEKYCSNCKYAVDYKDNLSINGDVILIMCPFDDDIHSQNIHILPIGKFLKLKNSHICSHWKLR